MTGKETDGYLVRTTSDGAVEFRMADAVVRAISMEAMRGFGVTRRRGAEVGGLLLGNVRKGVFTVEDCEIVPCEYAYGPSYLLSDNDTPKFAEASTRWRPAPGADKYAIGWFRSHTRDGLNPDAPDFELFHRHFSSAPAVLLLIKPYATRTSEAAVFVPEGGHLGSEPAIEFSFAPTSAGPTPEPPKAARAPERTSLPETAAAPAPMPVATPAPVAQPDNRPIILPRIPTERERLLQNVLGPLERPAEAPPKRVVADRELFSDYSRGPQRSWARLVAWTVFIAAAVVFGFSLGYRQAGGNLAQFVQWSPPIPSKDPYNLGLSARARGDSVLIQWDRYSTLVQNADRATVNIVSSNGREDIRLSGPELKSGVLVYKADIPEAEIRMEAFLPGGRSVAQQTIWRRSASVQQ